MGAELRGEGLPRRRLYRVGAILIVAVLAGGPAVVAPPPAASHGPTRIAFVRAGKGIFTIRPDGTGLRQVTNGHSDDLHYSPWSPDGRRIVFERKRWDHWIYTVQSDGEGLRKLTRGRWASWLPDGSIVFVRRPFTYGRTYPVRTIDPATGLSHTLFRAKSHSSCCHWSPDGKHALFWFGGIKLVSRDGSVISRLTHGTRRPAAPGPGRGHCDGHAAWSSDGTQIVFTRAKYDGDICLQYKVYVMDADGTDVHRVTTPSEGDSGTVGWSPDGTRIVFTHETWKQDRYDLYVMDADGSNIAQVTHTKRDERAVYWQPCPEGETCAASGALPATGASVTAALLAATLLILAGIGSVGKSLLARARAKVGR